MSNPIPAELACLLDAADPAAREHAWDRFVSANTRLLLHTARTTCREHDAAMDAYAYLLEALRQDDYRRLRAFAAAGRSRFTT